VVGSIIVFGRRKKELLRRIKRYEKLLANLESSLITEKAIYRDYVPERPFSKEEEDIYTRLSDCFVVSIDGWLAKLKCWWLI